MYLRAEGPGFWAHFLLLSQLPGGWTASYHLLAETSPGFLAFSFWAPASLYLVSMLSHLILWPLPLPLHPVTSLPARMLHIEELSGGAERGPFEPEQPWNRWIEA